MAGLAQPTITVQPQSQTNVAGSTTTLLVEATGAPPLSYQWRSYANLSSFTNIPFGTEAALVLPNVQPTSRRFAVVVTDSGGLSATSSPPVSLTILVPPGITRITNHSASVVGVRDTVRMEVFVTGTLPLILQWYQNGLPLAGKTNSILTLPNVQTTNSGLYTVVVTNSASSLTSSPVSLEVTSSPQIQYTATLQSAAVFVGTASSFAVTTAFGDEPFSYQWRLDGHELLGQTNKTLTLASTQPADEGDYTVVVSNGAGSVTNEPARLWVVPPASSLIRGDFTNQAGQGLPYFYLLPTNYNAARSYPLFCRFHGAGSFVNVFRSSVWSGALLLASYRQQATNPVILVFPTRWSAGESWTDQYLQLTAGLLEGLMSQFNVDTNRVYVAGFSQDVPAAWNLLGMRPGFFAAAHVGAGLMGKFPPSAIKDVPLWVACAADDGSVVETRTLVAALRQAGGNPIYTEYNSGGHVGGIGNHILTPTVNDWLLAQRRGVSQTNELLLSITSPTREAIHATGATNLNLGGGAAALGRDVTKVAWENTANGAKGTASGTNTWSATGVPLRGSRTNLIIVTATTTSWSAAYGGNTTFNDALTVIQSPLSATLVFQGTDALLNWTGGGPPYRVQRATDLAAGDWTDVLPNATPPVTLPLTGQAGFYRIVGQ